MDDMRFHDNTIDVNGAVMKKLVISQVCPNVIEMAFERIVGFKMDEVCIRDMAGTVSIKVSVWLRRSYHA